MGGKNDIKTGNVMISLGNFASLPPEVILP